MQVVYASPQNVTGDASWLSVKRLALIFAVQSPATPDLLAKSALLGFSMLHVSKPRKSPKVCCMWLTCPVSCVQGICGGLCQCKPEHTMPYSDHCTGSGAGKSQRCSKAISFHSCTTKLSWTHPILYLLMSIAFRYPNVSNVSICIQPRTACHSRRKKLRFVMAFMVLGCYCIQAIPQWLCCSAMGSAECGRPCILAPSWWRYAAWMGRGDALAFLSTDQYRNSST